ncbi:MAG TPA: 2OG-Fe(II) oxygenase [Burkholderiaceae bacterium]
MNVVVHAAGVLSIPDFLASEECGEYIAEAERIGFAAAGVHMREGGQKILTEIRNNDRVALDAPHWAEALWQRLAPCDLPAIDGKRAAGLASAFRFYRYGPGQRFRMHKDGGLEERGMASRMSFLIYLNDAFTGGATDFRDFNIAPQAGMALVFVHETWHEGCVLSAGAKYVLRSDVLFA